MVKFYIGLHQPNHANSFPRACLSINRIRRRKLPIQCRDVIVDSGAFTELAIHGRYRHSHIHYAEELYRLHHSGVVRISCAVSQDYMCETFMLAKTGKTIAEHQELTIERYGTLMVENLPIYILPVLQGYAPEDYARHLDMYGRDLVHGAWVGVGSVCKRNGKPDAIVQVLTAIKEKRPDLRLHGFGLKKTSLLDSRVRALLYSADSMAWSFAARRAGRDANSLAEAKRFYRGMTKLAAA